MNKSRLKDGGTSRQTGKDLVAVAVDLFARKGFAGTSIRDIAAEMEMSTSNIYHYFKTKGDILAAIERETLEPLMAEFRRIAKLDLPPTERLRLLMRTHLAYMDAHRKESKIFSFLSEEIDGVTKDANRSFQEETYALYRDHIESILSTSKRAANPTVATFSALGAVVWFLKWYQPEGKNSLDEVINGIVDSVLYGVIGGNNLPT